MLNLYEYHDYRHFLNDFYIENKKVNSRISFRMMGKSIGVDGSFLSKVCKGELHLTKTKISKTIGFCKLLPKEARYFEALFHFTKSTDEIEKARFYETMQSIRGVESLTIKTAQYEFYHKWYYSALWALVRTGTVRPKHKLGALFSPSIKESEVKEALKLLEQLDLIEEDANGLVITKDRHLKSGIPIHPTAVKQYHSQMIELANKSLYESPRKERDISGMTLAIDDACLKDIQQIMQETREKIRARVDKVNQPNRVVQTNFHMFPLAKSRGDNDS
ncbi:MAG: TIGR02147 family protein [Fibrobacterales bacterium]